MSIRIPRRLVFVRNRAGISAPLSIEKLATTLSTSGIDLPLAYEITGDVACSLQEGAVREIESDALAEHVAVLLAARVGADAADRYRAWRSFKQSGRPLVLCLLGAPGVGKSTAAMQLALRLDLHRVVPTEGLREVMRTLVPASVLPELHVAAHDAAASDALCGQTGFLRQARAVTAAAASVAERAVQERRSLVLVGSHLLPGGVREALAERGSDALVVEVLLTLEDPALHRATMLRRTRSDPAQPGVRHIRSFDAVRAFQQELRRIARAAGVVWQDLANPDELAAFVVDHVVGASASSAQPVG